MSKEQQKNIPERSVRITQAARKNHQELFPGHVSTLAVTLLLAVGAFGGLYGAHAILANGREGA